MRFDRRSAFARSMKPNFSVWARSRPAAAPRSSPPTWARRRRSRPGADLEHGGSMLHQQPILRTFAATGHFQRYRVTALRTNQTCAHAATAGASPFCGCGSPTAALQRRSPNQTFNSVNMAQIGSAHSPPTGQTREVRTNPTLGFRASLTQHPLAPAAYVPL